MKVCSKCSHPHSTHSFSSVAVEDTDPQQYQHLYNCNDPDCPCRKEVTGDGASAKTMLKDMGVAIGG